jgi:3-dehydroshikimate dehydratase
MSTISSILLQVRTHVDINDLALYFGVVSRIKQFRQEQDVKTGLCTIAFRDLPFDEVLDLAVSAGFDGVEPWGRPDHTPDPFDEDVIKRSADAVLSRGLEVSQFGSYANPTSDGFALQVEEALAISKIYQTNAIRVWVGDCGSAEAKDAQWEVAISGFVSFCDQAADAGMALVVEMHNGRLSDTVDGCLRLIEGVNRENFRMNFQPMFSNTSETTLDEAQRISPFVSTVHAQNYVSIGKNTRSLISDGLVDFNTVVGMFRAVGFDGYLEVEFVKEEDPVAALKADAAYLRELCETL